MFNDNEKGRLLNLSRISVEFRCYKNPIIIDYLKSRKFSEEKNQTEHKYP